MIISDLMLMLIEYNNCCTINGKSKNMIAEIIANSKKGIL